MKPAPYTPDEIVRFLRALENICRFNGHVKRFYSVADHTAIGLGFMEWRGQSHDAMRAFFVHDLPEAILGLGDITRDVKQRPEIARIVAPLEREAFDRIKPILPFDMDTYGGVVKFYDRAMAIAEVECIAEGIAHDDPEDFEPDFHGVIRNRIMSAKKRKSMLEWARKLWPGVFA